MCTTVQPWQLNAGDLSCEGIGMAVRRPCKQTKDWRYEVLRLVKRVAEGGYGLTG